VALRRTGRAGEKERDAVLDDEVLDHLLLGRERGARDLSKSGYGSGARRGQASATARSAAG